MLFRLIENKQSSEQLNYFRNSKATNSDGSLMIFHHGTTSSFTAFSRDKIDIKNAKIPGFWFSSDSEYSYQYGSVREYYLNITKPIPIDKVTITPKQLSDISGYSERACTQALRNFDSDYDAINTLLRDCTYAEYVNIIDTVNKVLGYDGYMYKDGSNTICVVFYPNQIKLVSNEKPTNSDSIDESADDSIIIKTESVDAYSGQLDMVKYAMIDNKVVGTLQYTIYEDKPHIQMIEVAEAHRRQGVATKLLKSLQDDFKGVSIDTGMRTPDGVKLFNSIADEHINPEYKRLTTVLNKLKSKDESIDEYWKKFWDTFDSASEEEQDRMRDEADKMQEQQDSIRDTIKDIEERLEDVPESVLYIK